MKKALFFALTIPLLVLTLKAASFERNDPKQDRKESALRLKVMERPAIFKISPVGMNLGRWTSWGSRQYSSNVLMNPGFEPTLDRVIIIVSQSGPLSFSDEAGWGYPDDYWNNAEFEVKTGPSAGKKGIVRRSKNSGEHGFPQYFSQNPLPEIRPNDIIVLTQSIAANPPGLWNINSPELVQIDTSEKKTGKQSVKLTPNRISRSELSFYADTLGRNMLPINGAWELNFWAKSNQSEAQLEILFERVNGTAPFIKQTLSLSDGWKQYSISFTGADEGKHGYLRLVMTAYSPDSTIWLDNMVLKPANSSGAFRSEAADALKVLKPSYLREFARLPDAFPNRIAEAFERQPVLMRITGMNPYAVYGYSLPDFLSLCKEIGANPWLIIPPVFSDEECRRLGVFLANHANKSHFSEVILEYGYRDWDWFYRSGGIPYPELYGKAADRSFEIIAGETKQSAHIRFVANGPYPANAQALNIIEQTKKADGLAVNAYFFNSLNRGTPDEEILEALFKEDGKTMKRFSDELFFKGKSFAISEINLNAIEGDARAYERNRAVDSAASGAALAKKILEGIYAGADPIAVYALGQYEAPLKEINESVNLWGVVQHFNPSLLLRPTGLAVVMLNKAIGGNLHAISPVHPELKENGSLTWAAFKNERGWTAALVSKHPSALDLEIEFPDDGHPLPEAILTLHAKDPFETNEVGEHVVIVESKAERQGRAVKARIPPWGFIVLSR